MRTFRFKFLSQSQLGQVFAVSSHVIGDWLTAIGLRNERKRPSQKAHEGCYVETMPSHGSGTYAYAWHAEKTVAALEAGGHERAFPSPANLVEPPLMLGPFDVINRSDGTFQIRNPAGEAVLQVQGSKNADLLVRMLEAAHRIGFLEKYLGNRGGQGHAIT